MWESRAAQFRQVLPSCEQIVRFGIGIEESIAFHSAVIMRADMDRIPMGLAAYRIMRDVEDYNKFGEMKKKLADMGAQIFMMNQISARQKEAIMALARLQFQGVTENQILDVCRTIEAFNFKSVDGIR
jgi:hypothetical protein